MNGKNLYLWGGIDPNHTPGCPDAGEAPIMVAVHTSNMRAALRPLMFGTLADAQDASVREIVRDAANAMGVTAILRSYDQSPAVHDQIGPVPRDRTTPQDPTFKACGPDA